MGVNKFNFEGYYDPTPYAALTNIIKGLKAEKNSVFKPIVYICSPYSGYIDINVKKARAFCEVHPTMKPLNLISYPIKNSSLTNCIVLDPFGGSGSTLIACEQTNRICFTIEFDEKFADVIVKRYIGQVGTEKDVFLVRGGKKVSYGDIKKLENSVNNF